MSGFIARFLGIVLCSIFIFSMLLEEVSAHSKKSKNSEKKLNLRTSVHSLMEKRRDPFKPIKRRRPPLPSSIKPSPSPEKVLPISASKNPDWKLLGIIEGRFGRQAVIRISSQERVFVRPGLEVGRSGWIIKAISNADVLLEYFSSSTLGQEHSNSKVFSLSFTTLEQTS